MSEDWIYLDLFDLVASANVGIGRSPDVADWGLLESALSRAQATVFGEDAYPTVHEKAAALVHSLVSSHGLVDGNKRLGLAAILLFYGLNGYRLDSSQDERVDFIVSIADGSLTKVGDIAKVLHGWALRR